MLNFSPYHNPYPSQRQCVYAQKGMLATSQPLAAEAGIRMLHQGGNAIDAAIASAAALTVVEPTGCAIGGDAFALVWTQGQLHGLDASGHAPKALSIEQVKGKGYQRMPMHGWLPVTVPGCPSAWAALSKRFGKLPFAELLKPAIELAQNGFPVSPIVARQWEISRKAYQTSLERESVISSWFECWTQNGKAPKAGELFKNPALANTLEELAKTGCESLYRGELARRLADFAAQSGGFLSAEDLAHYYPQWVNPIKINYRGVDVWEIPPSGQGLVVLLTLNILQGFDFTHRDSDLTWHRQLEALKKAYSDGRHYISDPAHMRIHAKHLLQTDYAEQRLSEIGDMAALPSHGTPDSSGTVYLAAADGQGNMVSFIQSPYHGFGSGVVLPDSGISLQNRGYEFSLEPSHVNALKGGKKTFHTIIPGFLSQNGQPLGPFGVMGGYMQPQGHVQMVMNLVDFGLNPQAALDAPRWQWLGEMSVGLEQSTPQSLALALARRGHQLQIDCDSLDYGRGQMILRDPQSGVLCGGTEPRADSHIAVY